jgi:S1-C subfamily serine protease
MSMKPFNPIRLGKLVLAIVVVCLGAAEPPLLPPKPAETVSSTKNSAEVRSDRVPFAIQVLKSPQSDDTAIREAIEVLYRAADDGATEVQMFLGGYFLWGPERFRSSSRALSYLERAAAGGYLQAQCVVAEMLWEGKELPHDRDRALRWFEAAAKQGDLNSQISLAFILNDEEGADAKRKARNWFESAAKQGDPQSQHNFGVYLRDGIGGARLLSDAMGWFERAAKQGFGPSQMSLAVAFALGDGVPQSRVKAHMWFNIAAANGEESAIEGRLMAEQSMTREELALAQQQAADFRPSPEHRPSRTGVEGVPKQGSDGTGSGFFVTKDGYFVTNWHVVEGAKKIRVRVASESFEATLVRRDAANDLALLKVDGEFSALSLRTDRGARVAERVFTVGFPNPSLQGTASKYTAGEVSALSGPRDHPALLQISVPLQPGNSGGPLVDPEGLVVGVIVAQLDQFEALATSGALPSNVGYAIKGRVLQVILESVAELDGRLAQKSATVTDHAALAQAVGNACGLVEVER